MRKKTIIVIIAITSAALAGILLTQIYWVRTAYILKEEQFDNSVRIAVKSVINQLQQQQNDSTFRNELDILLCRKNRLEIMDYIKTKDLDSLLHGELKCMAISSDYQYGIYSKNSSKFVLSSKGSTPSELISSHYQFSLSSIFAPGNYYLSIDFYNKTSIILNRMELWVVLSVLFVLILIISFITVLYTIVHQKKLSELKSDFINNMTHEFKTPIATSTLAAEMIQNREVMTNPDRIKKYSDIIIDENLRLQNQVEQVLQVAILESGANQFKVKKINVNRVIESVINTFDLMFKDANIVVETKINAKEPFCMADRVHIVNVFHNLIDNAIKYSPINPKLAIATYNQNGNIVVSVKDNGIGIKKEHQKNIFKNLFRVPMGDIHEVRGFGLGLYYVKTIIDQFGGNIEVISEPGKGSDFRVYFPVKLNNKS